MSSPASPAAASPAQLAAIDEVITSLQTERGATLPILHGIQERLGFVPAEAVTRIAEALNLSRADVHGVLTYYHDFRQQPPGRHVLKLCRAEACQAMGCDRLVQRLESEHGIALHGTSADGSLTVEPAYCLGNCALSPSAMLDGRVLGRLSEKRLDALVRALGDDDGDAAAAGGSR